MLPSMGNIRLSVCVPNTTGIALCPNFSRRWHIMKKHWGNHSSEMEDKNAWRTPQAYRLVCRSSMTSGNTEQHLGWAILETVFLNLNYTKQWQDLTVMTLGKRCRDLLASLCRMVRAGRFDWTPFQTGDFRTNVNFCSSLLEASSFAVQAQYNFFRRNNNHCVTTNKLGELHKKRLHTIETTNSNDGQLCQVILVSKNLINTSEQTNWLYNESLWKWIKSKKAVNKYLLQENYSSPIWCSNWIHFLFRS